MGEVYNAAKEVSMKDSTGKPLQNLAIIVEPLWGDENLHDCIPIGKANSEAESYLNLMYNKNSKTKLLGTLLAGRSNLNEFSSLSYYSK